MYYAFQVLGWTNEQAVKASSEEDAWDEALKMAKEEEIRAFRKVSFQEYDEILDSHAKGSRKPYYFC